MYDTYHADSSASRLAAEFRHVGFSYPGGVEALKDVSLGIRRATSVGIVGPSGCGKSTLLSLLAHQNVPTSGEIWVAPPSASRHPLAMVFQKDTLLPWLTVNDNIKLHYRFRKSEGKAGVDGHVRDLIQMAGLAGFEKAFPYQLSGGMRRRVAFLTGVASRSEILLLDEPFSSLDEPTRVAIHQDVLRIVGQLETTVVLVTHDLAEAITLCDEVVILTKRPGSIATTHDVPFGDHRSALELRKSAEFLELYGELWDALSRQLESSSTAR